MKRRIAIIGGGVIGCAIARELSAFDADLVIIERASDVGEGASKANSGLVHAGYDAVPGSLKAQYNVQGSAMFEALCEELSVPYKRNGALVLAFQEEQVATLRELYAQGLANGVGTLELLDARQVLALEPHVNPEVKAALLAKTSAVTSPYELTFALADHAKVNGAAFLLDTKVSRIEKHGESFQLDTNRGAMEADIVVNCAGTGAGELHNQLCQKKVTIKPRKGEYYLLDHEIRPMFTHTMFQTPTNMGKGILVTPTVHDGLLLGPTAMDIADAADVSTTAEALREIRSVTTLTWPEESLKTVITTFAGIRAHEKGGDFIVGPVEGVPGAYEAIGIESPGLSSAPAIGLALAKRIAGDHQLSRKEMRVPPSKRLKPFADMSVEEKEQAYKLDPAYGSVVCRCEQITEAEIRAAIRRPVGATTLDGVKRRVRAGMGRCQGGFCSPRVMEILSEELGMKLNQITKFGGNSVLLSGRIETALREMDNEHE